MASLKTRETTVQITQKMLALLQSPTIAKIIILSVLRLVPTMAKYFAILLLMLNAASFPLVWHLRVFSRLFELHVGHLWHRATHFYLGKEKKKLALRDWHESHLPIGVHPFRAVWTNTRLVGLDDADFNLHMSNSSYPKTLDSVRFRLALATFPNLFRCGGWCPLAATHFHFIREIPMLTRYEVRTSIAAWDEKWIWTVSRFVKPPSKSSKRANTKSTPSTTSNGVSAGLGIPTLKTPATPLEGMSGGQTPVGGTRVSLRPPFSLLLSSSPHHTAILTGGDIGEGVGANELDAVSRALLEKAAKKTEEDGALLYTIAVCQLCYKQGRITVPPAVVLASHGFYAAPPSPSTTSPPTPPTQDWNAASRNPNAPPPYWPAVRGISGSMRGLAKFYAGGWRDVPEGERFWEEAFSACEAERRERIVPFVGPGEGRESGLRGGLEGVRALA
ncbi:Peptidase A1 domain-containing protein [Mycena venus]|uniref:Peptidase A1 domain-containing protein n=1 Tax=Mycena venus TaxID=2733690 RepID=A0A8H6X9J8_9AGAR|nr:Peptidase A1 domain-containing protein [Mycena venus]